MQSGQLFPRAKKSRQYGFDIARALAIFGMVIVNFSLVMGAKDKGPAWLVSAVGFLEGKAAALFVILAGVGISLLTAQAKKSGDLTSLQIKLLGLRKRALLLLVLGLAFSLIWPADILHFYGFYIIIGTFFVSRSDRTLFFGALVFMLTFEGLLMFCDYERGWDWDSLTYSGFWTLDGMVRHIFFNGFHPVFPWTAFLLFGMWVGRRNLTDHGVAFKLFFLGLISFTLAELASSVIIEVLGEALPPEEAQKVQEVFTTSPIPPTSLYLFSGGGVALMTIVFCAWLARGLQRVPYLLKPLIITGQFALTLYVGHIFFGMGILEVLGRLENQTLPFAVISSAIFTFFGCIFALGWARFFQRGPLELILRKLSAPGQKGRFQGKTVKKPPSNTSL